MIRDFHTYKVFTVNKEIITPKGHTFPQTALVTFYDTDEKEIKTLEMGMLSEVSLFEMIDKQEEMKLDHCYVSNFSLSKYRETRGLNADAHILLNNFSAEHSIFDVDIENGTIVDFSYGNFAGGKTDFSYAMFLKAPGVFQHCIFENGDVEFDYTFFQDGNVNFNKSQFGNGIISFKNSIFKKGVKNFEDVIFGEGQVHFMNTEFNEGDVNFSNTKFSEGRVSFKVARFGKGKVDFKNANFGTGEAIFEMTEFGDGQVNFRGTKFGDGKVDFTRSEFGSGQVSFIHTDFGPGNVSFVNTSFSDGKVSFKLAQFPKGDVDFHYSTFGDGDIIFDRAIFSDGLVDFRTVDFKNGKLSFYRTCFNDEDVVFEATSMRGGSILFKHTIFGAGKLNFDMADYEESTLTFENVNLKNEIVSFNQAKFDELAFHYCQLNNFVDLRILKANRIDLSESIIRDIIDLRSSEHDIVLKNINLAGVRLLGELYIDWRKNKVKELIYKQDSAYRTKSEQFRILKENYNSIGQYNFEDEAYVEFKRTELKADLFEHTAENKYSKFWEYPGALFKWLIFDKTGLYATNPVRVLFSMVIIYLCFSCIYSLFPFFISADHIFSSYEYTSYFDYVKTCFYFSGVTFYTIGYGDLTPAGYFRGVAILEGFVGVFMMAYFTVAFVRKILR